MCMLDASGGRTSRSPGTIVTDDSEQPCVFWKELVLFKSKVHGLTILTCIAFSKLKLQIMQGFQLKVHRLLTDSAETR